MKKLFLALAVMMSMLCTSCGFLGHNTHNQNLNNTTVVLQKKNYHIVRAVKGESTQGYFLGIGGLSPASLKSDAIRDMYQNAQLTGSQALINESVTFNDQFYLVYWKRTCVATALVIEFDE